MHYVITWYLVFIIKKKIHILRWSVTMLYSMFAYVYVYINKREVVIAKLIVPYFIKRGIVKSFTEKILPDE